MSRRAALRLIGGASAVVLLDHRTVRAELDTTRDTAAGGPLTRRQLLGVDGPALVAAQRQSAAAFLNPPVRTIHLVRPDDQLDVLIEFFDVEFSPDGNTFSSATGDGAVRFTFGSQHTAETAYQAVKVTPPTTSIPHMAARSSHVVASVDGDWDLSLTSLLELVEAHLVVQTAPGAPEDDSTVLEIPVGLAVSPGAGSKLLAAPTPFTVGDTTEVWVAELVGADGGAADLFAVHNLQSGPDPLVTLPTSTVRDQLVDNSFGKGPIAAPQLGLSSSGAFAKLRGDWEAVTLTRYRQRITTGRDIKVEVTSTGYLAPFGHRAAITTTTERIFTTDTTAKLVSAMRFEKYLTIIEPDVDLGNRSHQRDGGRRNLWTSIVATTDEHLQIVEVSVADATGTIPGISDIQVFGESRDLTISYVATDRDGSQVTFTMPATFVAADQAHLAGVGSPTRRLVNLFNGPTRTARRDVQLGGQTVAFADALAAGIGATSKSTRQLRFELDTPANSAPNTFFADQGVPAFNAAMAAATIVDEVVGNGAPFDVVFHPRWRDFGNSAGNFDRSFLRLLEPSIGKVGGDLPTKSVGAIEVVAEVFSQTTGAGPDRPDVDTPWDPAEALGEGSKLLGSLLLAELIELVPSQLQVPGIHIPNTTVVVDADAVSIFYEFKPPLKSVERVGFIATEQTQCCITIDTVVPFDGEPSIVTTAVVNDFTMVFPPGGIVEVVEIDFAKVTAVVASPGGLSVDPKITAWRLGSDLNFLQPIFDTLSSLGGLDVQLGSQYMDIDGAINLPSLSLGVAAIRNFHLAFGLALPLNGDPLLLTAGVGSKGNQVEVLAGFMGGSFFTTLDLDFHDSRMDWRVAAGVSLFAEIGFDAIVVSASVRLRLALDFVFNQSDSGSSVKVTGAVSIEGEVSVLGLVEVSVKVIASITYRSDTQRAVAKGNIHWAVDTPFGGLDGKVPLGECSFDLGDNAGARAMATPQAAPLGAAGLGRGSDRAAADTARTARLTGVAAQRAFAAAGASPATHASFGDLRSSSDWTEYSNAFA